MCSARCVHTRRIFIPIPPRTHFSFDGTQKIQIFSKSQAFLRIYYWISNSKLKSKIICTVLFMRPMTYFPMTYFPTEGKLRLLR